MSGSGPRSSLLLALLGGVTCAVAFVLVAAATSCEDDDQTEPTPTQERSKTPSGREGTIPAGELTEVQGDRAKSGEIDPCSLVTNEEVAEIVGQPVQETYRHQSPTVLCEYISREPFSSANIRVEASISDEKVQQERELAEAVGGESAETVSGLGDTAFAVGPLLYVREGDTLLILIVATQGSPNLDAAKILADVALKRLP